MVLIKPVAKKPLFKKPLNINTNTFVLKTKYQTDKAELEKKIPDIVKKNKTH